MEKIHFKSYTSIHKLKLKIPILHIVLKYRDRTIKGLKANLLSTIFLYVINRPMCQNPDSK